MSFMNIKDMKKQIEEMEEQVRLAEEEEARRASTENFAIPSTNGDAGEMLNLIRTEQSKMQSEVEKLLNEKVLPLEVRMDIFQSVMEQLDELECDKQSCKLSTPGSTLESVKKLEQSVDELASQLTALKGESSKPIFESLDTHNLKLEEDLIHSLLASVTDLADTWKTSSNKVLNKLQSKSVTFSTPDNSKPAQTSLNIDGHSSERQTLVDDAKHLWEQLCKLKESEAMLEPILFTNAKQKWMVDRIKLVNGQIQADDGKLWDIDDFTHGVFNYPWRFFPDEEFEVECWLCSTMLPLKDNVRFDGSTVYCGGDCDTYTILFKAKPGYRWLHCHCRHYFQHKREEEPTECEFCDGDFFHDYNENQVRIPKKKESQKRA